MKSASHCNEYQFLVLKEAWTLYMTVESLVGGVLGGNVSPPPWGAEYRRLELHTYEQHLVRFARG